MRISQISWKKLDIQPQQTWVHYDNIEYPRYSPSHRPQLCNLGKINNEYINLRVILVGVLIRPGCQPQAHAFDCKHGNIHVRYGWPTGSHVVEWCEWISAGWTRLTAPAIDYSSWASADVWKTWIRLAPGVLFARVHVVEWEARDNTGLAQIKYVWNHVNRIYKTNYSSTRSGN